MAPKVHPNGPDKAGETETDAIAALARQAAREAQVIEHGGRAWMILPTSTGALEAREITDPHGLVLPPPDRIVQAVRLYDKDSLVAYVERHGLDETVIFAEPFHDTFTAFIDWHGAMDAAHVDHSATLSLQRSEEWKRWSAISGKLMEQADFARFLEENAADVIDPAGADLLEIARDLSARRSVNWRRAIRLDNGDEQFEYVEQTEAQSQSRGDVAVPNKFTLNIPIYMNEPSVNVGAFLRWKLSGAALTMGVELHRPVFVQQAVFRQIGLEIGERCGKTVWTGVAGG